MTGEYRVERDNGHHVIYWRRTPDVHCWVEIGEATTDEAAQTVIDTHRKEQD